MDKLLEILGSFDIAKILPEVNATVGFIVLLARIVTFFVPLLILGLGLAYFLKPAPEANHTFGYRTYFGMGSVEAWLFAQKIAGKAYLILGGGLTAVMLVVSLFFSGKSAMATVITALICVIVELVLVVAVWVLIYRLVYRAYDKDGNRRKR